MSSLKISQWEITKGCFQDVQVDDAEDKIEKSLGISNTADSSITSCN